MSSTPSCAGVKNGSQALVVLYLLAGLAWAVLGFLWIFGAQDSVMEADCGYNSFTYWVGLTNEIGHICSH